MPPKEAKVAGGDDNFLAACFRSLKERPAIDYNRLASETSMSSGGAANKLRAIMKKLEDEGTPIWEKDNDGNSGSKKTATPKRKANGTPKRSRAKTTEVTHDSDDDAANQSNDGGDEENHDSDTAAPPKKRAKKTPNTKRKRATGKTKAKNDADGTSNAQELTPTSESGDDDIKAEKIVDNIDVDMKVGDAAEDQA